VIILVYLKLVWVSA